MPAERESGKVKGGCQACGAKQDWARGQQADRFTSHHL